MSHIRVKTEYQVEGPFGSTEKRILYSDHNNSTDVVNFYDENGNYIFSVQDCVENNFLDAVNRLYNPFKPNCELDDNVQYMDGGDLILLGKSM